MPLDARDLEHPAAALRDRLRELHHRRTRTDLQLFATAILGTQGLVPQPHHRLILDVVERALHTPRSRQLIFGPRGVAKTTMLRLAAMYALGRFPGCTILAGSHTDTLAKEISGDLMHEIELHRDLLGYHLVSDARDGWKTSNGSRYYARGAGQGFRGLRGDWVLLDDPIKSWEEAESEAESAKLWQLFHADLKECLKPAPTGGCIVISTVYNERDLPFRLENEEGWPALRLSARSEGEGDPLHRPEGVFLGEGTPFGAKMAQDYDECMKYGRDQLWWSQWQGKPTAAKGNFFNPDSMPVYEHTPFGWNRTQVACRGWDFAGSTRTAADWTVGLLLVLYLNERGVPRWIIEDVKRVQAGPELVRSLVKQTAVQDGHAVTIRLDKDPGQAGLDQILSYTDLLAGYPIKYAPPSGDKKRRAEPVAAQCNIGSIGMLKAPWNAALISELRSFDAGRNDDQVDSLANAFSELAPHASSLGKWMLM